MLKYISNKGGEVAVDFETAILAGYAPNGGLYVPEQLPQVSHAQLTAWKSLGYIDLAFEILSLFIDRSIMSAEELRLLLERAYGTFERKEVIRIHQLESRERTYVMELFHGPTLSFKDVGQAFLVNLVQFFLERRQEHLSLVVATTGDTGPAAAYYAAGQPNLEAWILYPTGKITEEQERQLTTLPHANVHPVAVAGCEEGSDDLDVVIANLYADQAFKDKVCLSSVNSINWGRIMMQTVHYFFGYLQLADEVGEPISMSVPSGGFGNLCAGSFARLMGLPIHTLIAANNDNACLHRLFSLGQFTKAPIQETVSSAIDILIPMNFWRYLYFVVEEEQRPRIKKWMNTFTETGELHFDEQTFSRYRQGFLSYTMEDEQTLRLIEAIYTQDQYLLDPHTAVAVGAADAHRDELGNQKVICLSTAHPAKFPQVIKRALGTTTIPQDARHASITSARKRCEKVYLCKHEYLEEALRYSMLQVWRLRSKPMNEVTTT